jgi:redox-sensitive bicupin YhaK (pirin superfamily)
MNDHKPPGSTGGQRQVPLDTLPDQVTLAAREVPLGGPRAMLVRRTLPHRDLRTIGAWCFVDDYGPALGSATPMSVPPHPHMGLQTVSWLLAGEVAHLDSTGGAATARPGGVNVMTAGSGIAHSEYSVGPGELRGVQLWIALPDEHRDAEPAFHPIPQLPRRELPGGIWVTPIVGDFGGQSSPAPIFSPLVGVGLRAERAATGDLTLRPEFEYGFLALSEGWAVDGNSVPAGSLRYLGAGAARLAVAAADQGDALLLGGEPMAEELLMWWNFVGRSHDEIALARVQWENGERFGPVSGDNNPPLSAPELPHATMRPRPGRPTRPRS